MNCSLKVPKRYSHNEMFGDLHRSKLIRTSSKEDIIKVQKMFHKADYPFKFINSTIRLFSIPKADDSFLILLNLIEQNKQFILYKVVF